MGELFGRKAEVSLMDYFVERQVSDVQSDRPRGTSREGVVGGEGGGVLPRRLVYQVSGQPLLAPCQQHPVVVT